MSNNHIILQCKDCKTIMVIDKKDFWHFVKCTHCDSTNVINIDEVYDEQ